MTIKWNDERSLDVDGDFFSYACGTNWCINVYCDKNYSPKWEIQVGDQVIDEGKSLSIGSAKVDAIVALKILISKISNEIDELTKDH